MRVAKGLGENPPCSVKQARFAVLYLSVPCAHIVIKHKSTDLKHGMTEQERVNNTEKMAPPVRETGNRLQISRK